MNKSFTLVLVAAVTVASGLLSSCVSGSVAQPKPIKENTLALLYIKRDNRTSQFRAEVFPIARYSNGKYQAASVDLTEEMREDANADEITKANAEKSIVKPNQAFTAYNGQTKLGEFKVDQLGIGQYSCSAFLVGYSTQNQTNLKAAFDGIPQSRESSAGGYMFGKQFDETSRWTIATQTPTTGAAPQESDRYSRDITTAATALIDRNPQTRKIPGRLTIEAVQVYDLDRDGKPEVFAQVRKGQDPKTIPLSRLSQGNPTTAYTSLWLTYQTNKPTVIASEVFPFIYDGQYPSQVIGVIDVNGDGIDEAIVRNNGYESVSFSVLEYRGNQLQSVFDGAGYGC